MATLHNELRVTPPLDPAVHPFYDRPYLVIGAARFASALRDAIADPAVRRLPLPGSLNQLIDSTERLEDSRLRERLQSLYVDGAQ